MQRILTFIIKIAIVCLLIGWIALIFIEYFNAKKEKKPLMCIKQVEKNYDDGKTTICIGLGYKVIDYDRKSISAIEFGPFFIEEKNAK